VATSTSGQWTYQWPHLLVAASDAIASGLVTLQSELLMSGTLAKLWVTGLPTVAPFSLPFSLFHSTQ